MLRKLERDLNSENYQILKNQSAHLYEENFGTLLSLLELNTIWESYFFPES